MTNESEPLKGLKVLVVDDEPDSLTFIKTVLEDNGATTLEAMDGFEALEVMRAERPDLVTLDLGMPGKNGVEVFLEMRQDGKLRDIPVCIITGRPEMRKLIYERSSAPPPEGYLNKPITEDNLLLNIRRIVDLRLRKAEREAAKLA